MCACMDTPARRGCAERGSQGNMCPGVTNDQDGHAERGMGHGRSCSSTNASGCMHEHPCLQVSQRAQRPQHSALRCSIRECLHQPLSCSDTAGGASSETDMVGCWGGWAALTLTAGRGPACARAAGRLWKPLGSEVPLFWRDTVEVTCCREGCRSLPCCRTNVVSEHDCTLSHSAQ